MIRYLVVLTASMIVSCSHSTGSRPSSEQQRVILFVSDSASAVYRARQFWDDYSRNNHLGLRELRTYSVERTDSSFVVTLVPVNIATRGGGVVVQVFRNGKAEIVRVLD